MFKLKITERCHQLLIPYIKPGDVVIDATIGNGHDTLFLSQQVGKDGLVLGFDIQELAIEETKKLLNLNQIDVKISRNNDSNNCINEDTTSPLGARGVLLFKESHCILNKLELSQAPSVIMFNLGYLPNGDKDLTTCLDDTIMALEGSLSILKKGGVLSVITYPGHEEGANEHEGIGQWLKNLSPKTFEVLTIVQTNRNKRTPVQQLLQKR